MLDLEAQILSVAVDVLVDGDPPEVHGFALAKRLADEDGSQKLTAHGTLYKALGRMEDAGLLSSRWEDAEAGRGGGPPAPAPLPGHQLRPGRPGRAHVPVTPPATALDAGDPSRMSDRLATAWVRVYTWRLPDDVAARRREELASDLHEHASLAGPHAGPAASRSSVGCCGASPPTCPGGGSPEHRASGASRQEPP